MVEGKHHPCRLPVYDLSGTFFCSTVLAEVPVPSVDVRSGQDGNPNRNLLVVPQPDYRRAGLKTSSII